MSGPTIEEFSGMGVHLSVLCIKHPPPYTVTEVKKAWRGLCRIHHPDRGGDEEEFHRVTHAYKSLTNPEYREKNKGFKAKSLNLNIPIPITFEEVFYGASFPVTYSVTEVDESGNPLRKEFLETTTLTINIEAGAFSGVKTPTIFQGKGIRCGKKRGDAIVSFIMQEHNKFKIVEKRVIYGSKLYVCSKENIPLNKCLRGGSVDVQTMHGVKRLRVPVGTRPGDELHIKKVGIRGDSHIVIVDVDYPTKKDIRKKDWSFLGIDWSKEEKLDAEEKEDKQNFVTKLLNARMSWE